MVALSPGTLADLQEWKQNLLDPMPGALLFPTERGTPLSRDNVWRRLIQPALEKVHLEGANFQVLRRTNASLSKKAKIDAKVAADQRGHGLGVSLEVYTMSDLEQKIEAVTRLESAINTLHLNRRDPIVGEFPRRRCYDRAACRNPAHRVRDFHVRAKRQRRVLSIDSSQ
jgi:hypothetical protein